VPTREEWIELKNLSGKDLDLNGWQLKNKDEKIKIVLEGKIKKDGFFILERGEDALAEIESNFVFKGAIKNENETLFLFDKDCQLQDEVFANLNWPAGDNLTKRTAERKKDFVWQTSQNPGGTPKAENSQGFIENEEGEKKPRINLSFPSEVFGEKEFEISLSVSNLESKSYDVKISVESDNQILSEIFDSNENFWQSSNYYLKEFFTGSSFSGNFRLKIKTKNFIGDAQIFTKIRDSKTEKIVTQYSDRIKIKQDETIEVTTPPSSTSQPECFKILITEIQIWDNVSNDNDFIELYNSCPASVDISGFQLKKRTSGGSEYSIRLLPQGSIIPAKGYFLWANSKYNVGADTASSETLARDNSLTLLDLNKNMIDMVAWGNGENQFVETSPFPQNPEKGQNLGRKWSDVLGNYIDTDNNQADFSVQNPTPKAKNSVSQ